MSLLVIVPSRLARGWDGRLLLEGALASIRAQATKRPMRVDVAVGVDPGAAPPPKAILAGARIVQARAPSQAAALNAAAAGLDHDLLAVLEDDDRWEQGFLRTATAALAHGEFVSSTQLQVGPDGQPLHVNDFPTPSGWLMRRETWDAVGGFDESFRFHLDNAWLGRLGRSGRPRVHLVEAQGPLPPGLSPPPRPGLDNLRRFGGSAVRIARHRSPLPLVRRLEHAESEMAVIGRAADARAQSDAEYGRLVLEYGYVPW